MTSSIGPDAIVNALLANNSLRLQDYGDYLRKGVCPSCNKPELFIKKAAPWQLQCGRATKCGWSASTRDLLPELFENFSKNHPPTKEAPNATADAYLGINRGFDLSKIREMYEQGAFQFPGTNDFAPIVKVWIDKGKGVWWGRFIDKFPQDGHKAHFQGSYKGMAWTPPDMTLEKGDRCFLVEGIFHAWAHLHVGNKAAACFSSGTFPSIFIEANKGKGVEWIIALDGDNAGRKGAIKFAAKLKALGEKHEVLTLKDNGKDWDDYYREGRLGDKLIEDGLYQGRLTMSADVPEKAYHHYVQNHRQRFIIDFRDALYGIEVEPKFDGECSKDNIQLPSPAAQLLFLSHCKVDLIANIVPEFLYMERDEIMDEQRYVFRITYANGSQPDIIALEGSNITAPDAFHKALLNKTRGGTFDGDVRVLKSLRDRWLFHRMKMVQSIPFVGYDKGTRAYVFQQHAYHAGKEIPLNKHNHFQVGQTGIKTSLNGVSINTGGKFNPAWLPDYVKAFHWQGLALLAFWTGSFFAQQIREKQKSFPFFEFTGEPGAGKTTALEFLWAASGRDCWEGFDVMKSTLAGRRRAFNQVSNMPVVIIETDRDNGTKDAKQQQFDFDACKPFFNGRGTGTLGVARRNNEIDEQQFHGTLIISQNAEVDGSEALLQRIVHCHVDKKHHGHGTREIARQFERQTSDTVGGFLGAALRKEREWLQAYESYFDQVEKGLSESGIQNERIAKNHAQVIACGYALSVLFPHMDKALPQNLQTYLWQRAKIREERLQADHPLVEQFWSTFAYLNSETSTTTDNWLNHSSTPDEIAVNLNQYQEQCRLHGQEIPDIKQLKKLLPHSKRHQIVSSCKAVNSRHLNKTIRCWIFKR